MELLHQGFLRSGMLSGTMLVDGTQLSMMEKVFLTLAWM